MRWLALALAFHAELRAYLQGTGSRRAAEAAFGAGPIDEGQVLAWLTFCHQPPLDAGRDLHRTYQEIDVDGDGVGFDELEAEMFARLGRRYADARRVEVGEHFKREEVGPSPQVLVERRASLTEIKHGAGEARPLDGVLAAATVRDLDRWAGPLAFAAVVLTVALYGMWRLLGAAFAAGTELLRRSDRPSLPRETSVFERFVAMAEERPDHPAVVVEGQATTYAELLARAEHLSAALQLPRGGRCAVLLERSLDLLVLHLALWRQGCTIVSLSPQESPRRVQMMAEDCGAVRLFCRAGALHDALAPAFGDQLQEVPKGGPLWDPERTRRRGANEHDRDTVRPRKNDESSLFFTSGSSGRPKGIVRTHEHEMAYVHGVSELWMQALAPGGKAAGKCRVLWAGAPGWLTIAWQAWAPLMVGGTVVILPEGTETDMQQNAQALLDVEVAVLIPSMLGKLLPFLRDFAPTSFALQYLFCVGEPCPSALVKDCYRFLPRLSVVNSYGLTETLECQFVVPRGYAAWQLPELCPIGAPAGCKVALLDGGEDAEEGELYFGGSLPKYLPTVQALDQARFVVRDGERWFRTGDLGKWTSLGATRVLCVTGRSDRQVKLRGMRVELDEVEAALSGVGRLAVLKHGQELAAFAEARAEDVRAEAMRSLPPHMRPALVVEGPLPLLANGKVDYVALASRLADPSAPRGAAVPLAGPDLLATPEGQQLLEEGMDSLAMIATMTPTHKREVKMAFMCMGVCLLGIITAHWRASGVGEALTRREDFFGLRPNGWGLYFFDVLMLEHGFHTFILLSGYMHARETSSGWGRTLLIYALFVAMSWPFQPLSAALGADNYPAQHGTFNWQRWFLLMVAVARIYTSVLQSVRCPPAVQVLAAAAGVLCFELTTRDLWRTLHLEPDGSFFTDHGYPWLGRPPYVGYALMWGFFPGCVLRFNMLHCFGFHYLRWMQLLVQKAGRLLTLPRVTAPLLFVAALCVEFTLGPLNNHYPCGLELQGLGTPRKVSWYFLELVVVTCVSLSMMATFYIYQCRPWEIVGQCTLPSYLFHGCLIHRTRAFIQTLPRIKDGVLGDASEVAGVLAVMVGQTLAWGLLFYGMLALVRVGTGLIVSGWRSALGLLDSRKHAAGHASARSSHCHAPVKIGESRLGATYLPATHKSEADTDGGSTQDTLSVHSAEPR